MNYRIRALATYRGEVFSEVILTCTTENLSHELAQLADMFQTTDGGMIVLKQMKEARDDRGTAREAGDVQQASEGTAP